MALVRGKLSQEGMGSRPKRDDRIFFCRAGCSKEEVGSIVEIWL